MKNLKFLKLFSLIALTILMLMLASCSDPIVATKTYLNDDNHVIVEYSDGTTTDLGEITLPEPEPGVTITNTSVNEEKHLIVEYSDGTKKDMGYVGVEVKVEVEVLPPLCTVTFVDANGATLSVQEVYKGTAAKAPDAPAIADKSFDKWDSDFSNVTQNMTVRPIYTNAAEFTVTFKDADGTVLKTQKVITGRDATAPSVANKADKIFTGWDKSFTKVTADITVTAQYRAKKTFTVTFNDYSGVTLGSASVKEGDSAKAPVTPTREGYSFSGWSSSLDNITANKTVTAKYTLSSGNNIFDISYSVSGKTVTATFAVKGTVKFCGMEGYVDVPTGLTFKSLTQGDGATANYKDGKVYFMFASNNGQNVTKDTQIMTVTFECTGSASTFKLNTVVSDIYDQTFAKVSHKVIGMNIKVK